MKLRSWSAAALVLGSMGVAAQAMALSDDPTTMAAGSYAIDSTHAFVIGKVNHFGLSNYTFRFDKFDANYSYDPAAPDAAKLSVSIDINSLNTGDEKTNKEFANDFMGAKQTPIAIFVSKSVTHTGNKAVVIGDLTLNGVTKPVTLDVTFNGYGSIGPMGLFGTKAGFTATTTVKRSQFDLTKYLPAVGDDVTIEVNAEFALKK